MRPRRQLFGWSADERSPYLQPIETMQQGQRFVAATGTLGRRQQLPGRRAIAARERIGPGLKELFCLPLSFRERAPCPLDIRTRFPVGTIEKEHARPDVDGEIVTAGEIVIETGEQQLFDSGVTITIGVIGIRGPIGAKRVGHAASEVAVMPDCSNRPIIARRHGSWP